MEHDANECRKTKSFNSVAQNLFQGPYGRDFVQSAEAAIELWYDEINKANLGLLNPYTFGKDYGHLSQMLWASSYEMGCAHTVCKPPKNTTFVACNYAPSGNIVGGFNTFEEGDELDCFEGSKPGNDGLCEPDDNDKLRKTLNLKNAGEK